MPASPSPLPGPAADRPTGRSTGQTTSPAPGPATAPTTRSPGYTVLLATGGTIACTQDSHGDLRPTLGGRGVLKNAGLDTDSEHREIRVVDVAQLDSSALTLSDIDRILAAIAGARDQGADRVIVTHGTDTLEETAMAADRLLPPGGPVIFTGAQRPADDCAPDGPANLRAALDIPLGKHTRPVVCFGGQIIPAYGATKNHTTADAGFGCAYDPRIEDPAPAPLGQLAPLAGLRVDIVPAYAGADGSAVDPTADGLVVVALGSGNIPPAMRGTLDRFAGPVVVCSRVPAGGVHFRYGGPGGGAELQRAGVRSGGTLRPAQARIELLCELAVERQRNRSSAGAPTI
ncbi:L-asparaginase [Corynebacterium heidelbergense]|uniref:asparaginase n=1 Tax=Corynebacterium heidelbergense TaxID=2055947 RepID=A0A364V3U0_9CORY|nr:L-asparaginase [Corynebacterium heidelbergense]